MAAEKTSLRLERFPSFRQMDRVPMSVRHRIEYDQSCVHACPQQRSMKVGGSAEQHVAYAGHAERGREALQVRINRGESGIFRIVIREVRGDGGAGSVLKSSKAANAID